MANDPATLPGEPAPGAPDVPTPTTPARVPVSLYVDEPTRRRIEAYRVRLADLAGVPVSTSAAVAKLLGLALDGQGVADPGPDEVKP